MDSQSPRPHPPLRLLERSPRAPKAPKPVPAAAPAAWWARWLGRANHRTGWARPPAPRTPGQGLGI